MPMTYNQVKYMYLKTWVASVLPADMKCLDEKIGIDKKSVFSSNIVVQKILV